MWGVLIPYSDQWLQGADVLGSAWTEVQSLLPYQQPVWMYTNSNMPHDCTLTHSKGGFLRQLLWRGKMHITSFSCALFPRTLSCLCWTALSKLPINAPCLCKLKELEKHPCEIPRNWRNMWAIFSFQVWLLVWQIQHNLVKENQGLCSYAGCSYSITTRA